VILAERDRFSTDSALARRPVHPNPPYARVGAVIHNRFGGLRRSHQQRGFDGRLNVLHASEASSSLYLRAVWIHRNNVIPAPAQFFEQLYTEIPGIP
jgi:hypothetical protein